MMRHCYIRFDGAMGILFVMVTVLAVATYASMEHRWPLRPPLPPLIARRFPLGTPLKRVGAKTTSDAGCYDPFGRKCDLCCHDDGSLCCEDVRGAPPLPIDIEVVTLTVRFTLLVSDNNPNNWSLTGKDVLGQLRVLNSEYEASGSRFRFTVRGGLPTTTRANETPAISEDAAALAAVTTIRNTSLSRSCATDSCYDDPLHCAFNTVVLPSVGNNATFDINVIVCDISYDGESQFPWAVEESSILQYVQIRYGAFFNKGNGTPRDGGKTLVHEMGHYLGLLHTFDGDCLGAGDYVTDTPPARHAATPANPCTTISPDEFCSPWTDASVPQPVPDVSNFMDYAGDRCMSRFTPGQVQRMEQAVRQFRPLLINNSVVTLRQVIPSALSNATVLDHSWWTAGNNGRGVMLIVLYCAIALAASAVVLSSARNTRRFRPMSVSDGGANEDRPGEEEMEELTDAEEPMPRPPKWLRRHHRRCGH